MKTRRFSTTCAFWALASLLCGTFRATAGQSSSDASSLFSSGLPSSSAAEATSSVTWSTSSAAQLTPSATLATPTDASLTGLMGSSSQSSVPNATSTTNNTGTMALTMPTTTGTTAPPTIVVPNQNLASTNQYLLTTVIVAPNVSSRSSAFWLLMESRLATVCQMAFDRNEAITLGTYASYKRRKRVTTVGDVTVQMVNVTRLTDYPARVLLVFAVAKNGLLINATVTVSVLGLLDVQEIVLVLQYVVKQFPQAFNYVAPQDLQLWIIAAVLGPVALIALIWIITCIVLRNRQRRKQISAGRAKVAMESEAVGDPALGAADGRSSKGMATPLIGWSAAVDPSPSARGAAKEQAAEAAAAASKALPLLPEPDRLGKAAARGQPRPRGAAVGASQAAELSAAEDGGRTSRAKRSGAQTPTAVDVQLQQRASAERPLPSPPTALTFGHVGPATTEASPEVPPRRPQPLLPLGTDALYAEVRPIGRVPFGISDVDADSSISLQKKQKRRLTNLQHMPSLGSASSQQNIISPSETESEANDAGGRSPLPRKSRAQMHKILDAVMYAMFDETDSKKVNRRPRSSSSSSTSSSSSSSASGSGESKGKSSKDKEEKKPPKDEAIKAKKKKKKNSSSKSDKKADGKSKGKPKKKKQPDDVVAISGRSEEKEEEEIKQARAASVAAAAASPAAGVTGHGNKERIADYFGRTQSTTEPGHSSTTLAAEEQQPRVAVEAWAAQPIGVARPDSGSPKADEKRHIPLRLQPIRGPGLATAASQPSLYQFADAVAQLLQPTPTVRTRPPAGAVAAAADGKDSLPPPHAYRGTGPNRVIAGMQETELAPLSETDGYTSITMTTAMLGLS